MKDLGIEINLGYLEDGDTLHITFTYYGGGPEPIKSYVKCLKHDGLMSIHMLDELNGAQDKNWFGTGE